MKYKICKENFRSKGPITRTITGNKILTEI